MHLVPASIANLGQHQFEVNRVRMAGGIKRIVLCKIQSPVPVKLWPARFGFQNQAIIQIGLSGSFCFWTLLGAHFGANPRPLDVLDAIYVVIKKQIKVFQDWSGMRASIGTLVFWASKRLLHNTSIWFQIVSKRCWQLKKKSITSLALCGRSFPSSVIGLPDSQVWGRPLVQSRPPQLQHPPPESWV